MSLSKRMLDDINAKNSPANCPNCKVDWDIKDYILCAKHQTEFEEREYQENCYFQEDDI